MLEECKPKKSKTVKKFSPSRLMNSLRKSRDVLGKVMFVGVSSLLNLYSLRGRRLFQLDKLGRVVSWAEADLHDLPWTGVAAVFG